MTLIPICIALLALTAPPEPDAAKDAFARSLAALAAAEKATVTIDAKNADAASIVERFNTLNFVPVRADWAALKRLAVERDDKVDFFVHEVTLLDAVRALAQTLGSEMERPVVDAAPGQIVITTAHAVRSMQEVAIYDVADIASDPTLLPTEAEATVGTGASAPGDDDLEQRMKRLVDLIVDHVDPDGWQVSGGSRGTISAEAARLVVSATPDAHRKLKSILTKLRRESPLAVCVGMTLYDVPRAALDELEKTSKGDAAALAAALVHCDDARRGWSPRVVARLEEEASLETKEAQSDSTCKFVAKHDRIVGVLTVTLELKVHEGPATASFKGVLPFADGAGAVAITLPTGPGPGRSWVLRVEASESKRD